MKNKLFLAFAASLFAGLLVFNLNLAQNQPPGDISLEGIALVASAEEPIEGDPPTNPGNLYQSMSRCGSWFSYYLCCTTNPRAYLCTRYVCFC